MIMYGDHDEYELVRVDGNVLIMLNGKLIFVSSNP
jgi:hypothetical protein